MLLEYSPPPLASTRSRNPYRSVNSTLSTGGTNKAAGNGTKRKPINAPNTIATPIITKPNATRRPARAATHCQNLCVFEPFNNAMM